MQSALLTGCAGFIGSHAAGMLLEEGYRVYGVDNFDPFYAHSLKEKNLQYLLSMPEFYFSEADITDPSAFNNFPSQIDIVLHFAAKAGARQSIYDPQSYIKANIIGTQNILDWMKVKGLNKLIFASSSSVYGNNQVPFKESDPVNNQVSPYAVTKRAGELMTNVYHKLFGIDVIDLRFFTVYGPRQRPDLAIYRFTDQILNGNPVTIYGDGSSGRDYTFIGDTINGVKAAIDYLNKNNRVFEIVNIGNNHPVTLNELIETIYRIIGGERKMIYEAANLADAVQTAADITKAGKLFDYKPATTLEEGIMKFVAWYRQRD